MEPVSITPPAHPSSRRPRPVWAKRCLTSGRGIATVEKTVDAQETSISSGNFPAQSLRSSIQASVSILATTEGASSRAGARFDPGQIRLASCDQLETCLYAVGNSSDVSMSSDSQETSAAQKNMETSLPRPPAYPSTGRPKLSSKKISAVPSEEKQASVPGNNEGLDQVLPESSHLTTQVCVWHAKTNTEQSSPEESAQSDSVDCESKKSCSFMLPCAGDTSTYSDVDDASATRASIIPNAAGLRCTVCSTPPQLRSMLGCWKMVSSVDVQRLGGTPHEGIATWLTRLCILNRTVRDGNGGLVPLKVRRGERYLEGGRLYLDSNGVLHRYGKSGSHVCFRRDMQNCQLHLAPIYEHDDMTCEDMDQETVPSN